MRFTLTYHGTLRGSKGTAAHKHDVRRALHPQLRELWTYEPLSGAAQKWLAPTRDPNDPKVGWSVRELDGHTFAVLVHAELKVVAELDILLLRANAPGAIVQHADIDNRLKTLFDALRCPDKAQEIPAGWTPAADEQPLYCLLDDDRLITRVNLETDRLLAPDYPDDVDLTVRVRVRTWSPTIANSTFL